MDLKHYATAALRAVGLPDEYADVIVATAREITIPTFNAAEALFPDDVSARCAFASAAFRLAARLAEFGAVEALKTKAAIDNFDPEIDNA